MSSSSGKSSVDPLLEDLNEKKQSFRRNVVSLVSELKEVRSRLSSQEQSYLQESLSRQEAESRTKNMEKEIHSLQIKLEQRNDQLQASTSVAKKYLKELDNVRLQLSATQATAEASAVSAQSAQLQCSAMIKEVEVKDICLKKHEESIIKLGEQLDTLQSDLQTMESSQKQLKDEVVRIEKEIMKAGTNKDCELLKLLDEISQKNFERFNKHILERDEEIRQLRDEIRFMSTYCKLKTKEVEIQLEKHRQADQELKKKVLKLEFSLHETRAQNRKLQRMGERRDRAINELQEQLAVKQRTELTPSGKTNFWETSNFKIVVSMSMLILVVFCKR